MSRSSSYKIKKNLQISRTVLRQTIFNTALLVCKFCIYNTILLCYYFKIHKPSSEVIVLASQPIYQFYSELNDYEPKMWRRFQVFGNITMARLGYILMTMYEMQAEHLFQLVYPLQENFEREMKSRQIFEEVNVIKLRKRVLDAMYEESKTLFANIFVNLSKKVLTNQEKCAAVFANSENGPCN